MAQTRPRPNAGILSLRLPALEEMKAPAVRDFMSGSE